MMIDFVSISNGGIPPPLSPPHKGEGDFAATLALPDVGDFARTIAPASPSPLWGGVRGGGVPTHPTER